MTFQQLEYIAAVDEHRHFVNAATACGVTQSTLSSTIAKLEQEIDVVIFDRSKHPIEPTVLGQRIITQAKVILHNSQLLRELVINEKTSDKGRVLLGMIPSVAPYLYPNLSRYMKDAYPNIHTNVTEASSDVLLEKIQRSELDMAIVSGSDIKDSNLLEIELYTERFMLYTSPASPLWHREWIRPEDMLGGDMWSLRSFHDRYPQLTTFAHREELHTSTFDSGGIITLIHLVNNNGGYTIIPELMRKILTPEEQLNLRPIQGPKFFRTVSLVIRQDYLRERMLNIIADAVQHCIPSEIFSSRLQKFKITI